MTQLKTRNRILFAATSAAALLTAAQAGADTRNWQLNGTTNNWTTDPGDANWFVNNTGPLAPWVDGNVAAFDAANAETVTLNGSVQPSAIVVDAGTTTPWTITGTGTIDGPSTTLVKNGPGLLTLSNTTANTFGGGTTINAGTISLGTGGGTATSTPSALGTGPVTINANGTLRLWIQNNAAFTYANNLAIDGGSLNSEDGNNTVSGAVTVGPNGAFLSDKWNDKTLTVSGVISGAGPVTIRRAPDGGGTAGSSVVLTGNNTYTGRTYLTTGATLRVGLNNTALGTAPLTVVGSATLATAAGGGARTLANGVIVNPGVTANLDSGNATLQLNGVISGGATAAVSKNSSGDLVLNAANQYAGGTSLGGGIVRIAGSDAGLGGGPVTVTAGSTVATQTGFAARTLTNPFAINSGVTLSADGGYFPITFAAPISGAGNFSKASSGTVILGGANAYTGTTNTGTGAGTLQVGDNGSSGTLPTGSAVTVATGALSFNRGDSYTVPNVIAGTGTGAVVQAGAGTTTLTGASTYTNPTTVNNGTLLVNGTLASPVTAAAGGRLGGTGSTTSTITFNDGSYVLGGTTAVTGTGVIANGATNGVNIVVPPAATGARSVELVRYGTGPAPTLTSFNAGAYRNGVLTDDAGLQRVTFTFNTEAKVWNGPSGTWEAGSSPNWVGTADQLFFNGDNVSFNEPGGASAVSIPGVVSPGSIDVSVNGTSSYTFANGGVGTIAGTGTLTKAGTGTLTMTGTAPNRYSGGTIIAGGTLALGTGGTAAFTSSAQALGGGPVYVNAGGTLKLWIKNDVTHTIPNALNVDGGRVFSEDGVYNMVGAVTIGSGGMSVGAKWSGKNLILAGPISGGNLTAAGETTGSGAANTTVLLTNNNNSYGTTTVTSGTLAVGNGGTGGSLGTGAVSVAAGAVLNLNRADPFTVSNVIGGAGAVTKTAAGTATLSGASNYTGATTVSAGSLLVTGSLTGSPVTVNGGSLGGTGSITGTLNVAAAGTVNPGLAGPSIGTLAAGATTIAGTSAFDLGTPGTSKASPGVGDLLAVTGNLTLGGTISVLDNATAGGNGSLGQGTYLLYTYTGTLSGAPTSIVGPTPYTYALDTTTPGAVYLNVVPEPTSAGLIALAGVGLLARRRRAR